MKNKMLRNGVEMPEVGFGTWKAGETDGFAVLSEAIRAGYRHIDTASAYHTEEAVGRAVDAALCLMEKGVNEAQNKFN